MSSDEAKASVGQMVKCRHPTGNYNTGRILGEAPGGRVYVHLSGHRRPEKIDPGLLKLWKARQR